MQIEEYVANPLWPILVEVVHAMVMYPHHKAFIREVVLHEKPESTIQELATELGIPFGQALVIVAELEQQPEGSPSQSSTE
jgi:hypothetical protein